MNQSKKNVVKDYLIITVGMVFASIGIYFFLMPSNIILGSITGLAMVLVNFFPVPVSVMTFILNVICLIVGFIFVGKDFGGKTVYSSMLLPIFLNILEHLFPQQASLTGDVLMDMICCIIILSAGQALMFNANASSGGLDILAKVMNKYTHVELGKSVSIIGIVTVLTSIFVYDTKTLVVGMLATYMNGLVVDAYIGGFTKKKRICILTDDTAAVTDYILHTLERGVTQYVAKGAYAGTERTEIVTILTNTEYGQLMEYIRTTCPQAFVTISNVNEVVGVWNTPAKGSHGKSKK